MEEAWREVNPIIPDNEAKKHLEDLSSYLINR